MNAFEVRSSRVVVVEGRSTLRSSWTSVPSLVRGTLVPMYRCRPFEVYKVGPVGVDQKINTPMYDIVGFIFAIQWRPSQVFFEFQKIQIERERIEGRM